MVTERQIRVQAGDRREFKSGRRHSISQFGASGLAPVLRGEFLQGIYQRIFRMVRRSGYIFLASRAGCGDAAV